MHVASDKRDLEHALAGNRPADGTRPLADGCNNYTQIAEDHRGASGVDAHSMSGDDSFTRLVIVETM